MDFRDEAQSETDDGKPGPSAPGTGEKLARQGHGYQDKAAAERILSALGACAVGTAIMGEV